MFSIAYSVRLHASASALRSDSVFFLSSSANQSVLRPNRIACVSCLRPALFPSYSLSSLIKFIRSLIIIIESLYETLYLLCCVQCVCQSNQLWLCTHSVDLFLYSIYLLPLLSVSCLWSVFPVLRKSNRNVASAIQLQPYTFIAYVFRLRYFMRSGKGIACGFNLQRFRMHEDCRTKIWY